MPDIVKKYLEKIKEFWNKYNKKQKTIFIASVLVVVIALIILATVIARPQNIVLRYCSTALEATEVRDLLTQNGITSTVGPNFEILIDEKDQIEAQLILGSNNISSNGFSLSDALSGGFSQTESDKEKMYQDFLEKKFSSQLEQMDGIKSAQVNIKFEESSSIFKDFSDDTNASITAILTTARDLDDEAVEAIGLFLANNVGNKNTNNVTIIDHKGSLLFSGITDSTSSGYVSDKFKRQLVNNLKIDVKQMILATQLYSEVNVMVRLGWNEDRVTEVLQEYMIPDGSEQGLYSRSYEVTNTGTSGSGGVPGTESNDDDTGYMIEDGTGTNNEYNLNEYDYLQNSRLTTTERAAGTVNYDDSNLSATFIRYNVVSEEDLQLQGLLEGTTYEEYKLQNSDPIPLDVDENLTRLIANGTGIGEDNIVLAAYQVNVFLDPEESSTPVSFIIQIILAVLIVALLLFVVFRSARPVAVAETEPELSVEDMLASTREQQAPLDDIDLQDKSEARKAIEKFVQENPEAVALLLRNWLNEGWD